MRVPVGYASCEEARRPAEEEIAFESDGQKETDEREATYERRSGARCNEDKQGGGGRQESAAGGGSEKSVAGEHLGWNGRGAARREVFRRRPETVETRREREWVRVGGKRPTALRKNLDPQRWSRRAR